MNAFLASSLQKARAPPALTTGLIVSVLVVRFIMSCGVCRWPPACSFYVCCGKLDLPDCDCGGKLFVRLCLRLEIGFTHNLIQDLIKLITSSVYK